MIKGDTRRIYPVEKTFALRPEFDFCCFPEEPKYVSNCGGVIDTISVIVSDKDISRIFKWWREWGLLKDPYSLLVALAEI